MTVIFFFPHLFCITLTQLTVLTRDQREGQKEERAHKHLMVSQQTGYCSEEKLVKMC